MNAIHKYRYQLDHLLHLIRHQQLGSLQEAAHKLCCSQRTVKYRIAKLRKEGNNIVYDRKTEQYVLKKERVKSKKKGYGL